MTEASLRPIELRCEYLRDPLGIDVLRPRLSWVLEGDARGARQSAYRVVVTAEGGGPSDGAGGGSSRGADDERGPGADGSAGQPDRPAPATLVWDSGRVESDRSVHVAYEGPPLRSRTRYHWTLTVWDEDGQPATSAPAFWEMGLLALGEWEARWIGLGNAGPFGTPLPPGGTRPRQTDAPPAAPVDEALRVFGERRPSPYLRTTFDADRPVRRARIYATARGLYELRLNGERVGDARLAPGWTDYGKRIQVQTYDVTDQLRAGANALGAVLGDGWYAGHVGFDPRWRAFRYGYKPSLLLRLELEYADGEGVAVVSDGSWRSATGQITFADLLMGEAHDARLEPRGWDLPGFDDASWEPAAVIEAPSAALVAQPTPPVRVTQELAPVAVREPRPGVHLFDLGQNMVGWARLAVEGPRGTAVTLRFGEMVDAHGMLYTENLRSARQTDVFVLAGDGRETFEPRFTFHGFRYVEVTGLPEPPTPGSLVGCVAHDDLEPAGEFDCSSPLLNQLQRNIRWGQRGNFLSVPTDCPQRDERMGWLGDAQIFLRTASYAMDVAPFFTKWMRDVSDAQSEEGAFPDVAPRAVLPSDGAPGWGDGGVIIPWTLYQVYGDVRVLEQHYDAMGRWMAYLGEANPQHLRTRRLNMNFGDWLAVEADTPKELLATAYYALDAKLMARVAGVLGKEDDARRYAGLFDAIRTAFAAAYVSPEGRVAGETQTGYLLALHVGLLPEALRARAAARLVDDIEARGGHLSTGFLGVGYLAPVLSDAGHTDVAYRLALCDTYPSWGYGIRHGATTIWERWDGWTEERGFQTPGMNSFNHYAFGSIGEWLYRYVAGIDLDPDRPGFQHVVLRPRPGGGLSHAGARYRSIRGDIVSRWQRDGDRLVYEVRVPANTTATLHLPAADAEGVREGGVPIDRAPGVTRLTGAAAPEDAGTAVFQLASGRYRFESLLPASGVDASEVPASGAAASEGAASGATADASAAPGSGHGCRG